MEKDIRNLVFMFPMAVLQFETQSPITTIQFETF